MNTKARSLSCVASIFGAALIPTLIFLGCGGESKVQAVAVGEMEEYRDPAVGFHIQHPKGWIVNAEVERARFYNAHDVDKKFLDPTGAYPIGVSISVDVRKTPDPAAAIKQMKDELTQAGVVLGQEQSVAASGKQATKLPYTANYGGKNIIHGHHVLISVDSAFYDLGFAGFGDNYNAYAAVFDSSLSSFELPAPVEKGKDRTLPSEVMSENDAKLFTFQYPENFNFETAAKGKNDLAISLRGENKSCSIQFIVFGAQGLTLEKVFDQNKGKYAGATTGKATIGGVPALSLTYPATRDVQRRFYFVVRNDKVYRVTMDWFKPQQESYLASYEKVIASIKFK